MFRAPGLWSAALLCATMLAWPAPASPQGYPARSTKVVVPFPAPGNQNPFGKSFAHFSRRRSSSALLERAMTGKVFLRRNGMQASMITRELRRSVSVS